MQIRGIIFDAYGTLFDVHSVASLAEEIFPSKGVALSNLWRDKQIEYTRLRTLSSRYVDFLRVTEDALRNACARLRLPLAERDLERLLAQYHRLDAFPDAVATLQRLRSQGFALAILSNGTPGMLESVVDSAGMSGLFDHLLSADEVHKFKTAPEVYQMGVAAFGCSAAELVFVSANGWDACCATWFGYQTFWINRASDPVEQLGVAPTRQGRQLNDLTDFVDRRTGS
jgi:2-haloacid dehalogenase